MNRRGFLAMLAGAALDPERALWVPKRYVHGVAFEPPIMRCPFIIIPTFAPPWDTSMAAAEGRRAQADVLNAMLEHRWNTDRVFRENADSARACDYIRTLEMTVGIEDWTPLLP